MCKCMTGVVGGTRDELAITQKGMRSSRSRGVLYALKQKNGEEEVLIAHPLLFVGITMKGSGFA